MKLKKNNIWCFAFKLNVFFCLLSFSFDLYANLEGSWVYHPAATLRSKVKESQVDRIIDGNRYVYFSVRGSAFNRSEIWYYSTYAGKDPMSTQVKKGVDPLQLFRYDKTEPWEDGCIKPVASDLQLSGTFHRVLEYSPTKGVLAVIYDDKSMDFIHDDGILIKSEALLSGSLPIRNFEPYSVTFDDEMPLAYVSGSYGIATVNINTGELESINDFGEGVAWAARVGDKMVVIAGKVSPSSYTTETYLIPKDMKNQKLGTPIIAGSNLQALMPLANNTFAALAPGSSDTQNIIRVFVISGNSATYTDLTDVLTVDNSSHPNYRNIFRTDGFVSPTRDGYAVHSANEIDFLQKGTTFSSPADFRNRAFSIISKSSLSETERNAKSSSADGKTVYFFFYDSTGLDGSARGFYSRQLRGGIWEAPTATITPNAPTCAFPYFVKWSPKYGMLFRGPGSTFVDGSAEKDYFSSYKDGKWTDLSYAANNSKYDVPADQAKHICIDPVNQDWIWGNPAKCGLLRMNLSDFSDFLEIGSTARNWVSTYPGFFQKFTSQAAYALLINFSNMSFDSEGRMWFARFWLTPGTDYDYEDITHARTPLYYYTADEREQMGHSGSGNVIAPHELSVPATAMYHNTQIVTLKGAGNENTIIGGPMYFHSPVRRLWLYDHKGTLENDKDDDIVYIEELYDERGDKFNSTQYSFLYEDERTGDVWICTNIGPIIVNPKDLFGGKMVGRRPHINKKFGSPSDDYPFEQVQITGIDKDLLGRYWISSGQGLYCLSADGNDLLGAYYSDNSSLPADNIRGVACDGATGSVFILTEKGIAEFIPEGTINSVSSATALKIWPTTLSPQYKGYLNISGAQEGMEYVVFNKNGEEVISLGKPAGGMFQWDGKDSSGNRVAPGRYNVKRRDYNENNSIIIVE